MQAGHPFSVEGQECAERWILKHGKQEPQQFALRSSTVKACFIRVHFAPRPGSDHHGPALDGAISRFLRLEHFGLRDL